MVRQAIAAARSLRRRSKSATPRRDLARRHRPAHLRARLRAASTSDTIFDLASLTKVIATTTLVMRAVDDGRLAPRRSGRRRGFAEWTRRGSRDGDDPRSPRARVGSHGISAVLQRSHGPSGVPARDLRRCRSSTRRARNRSTATSGSSCSGSSSRMRSRRRPASAAFRARSTRRDRSRRSFTASRRSSRPSRCAFNPPRAWRPRTAPTEDRSLARAAARRRGPRREHVGARRRRRARGLFGTAAAVGTFARAVLRTIAGEPILADAGNDAHASSSTSDVPGSSRALGWDTMLPTSSCGTQLSLDSDRPHRASRARRCGLTGSGISTSCC